MCAWFRKDPRRELLARPLSPEWLGYLRENVRHYSFLNEAERLRLHGCVQVMAAEKQWEGCGGQSIDDEVKVTIAGQAALLVVGLEHPYYFDRLSSILVYPNAYAHPPALQAQNGVIDEDMVIYGESWSRGPIVLSWDQVLSGAGAVAGGHNLVLHEFAHYLDDLDGAMDGVPPLENRQQYKAWYYVTETEYVRLRKRSERGQATLLDQYGTKNMAEFFAVSTECFFQLPVELSREHPELYGVLSKFYHQDPARWNQAVQASAAAKKPAPARVQRRPRAVEPEPAAPLDLPTNTADGHFSLGVVHLNAGRFKHARAEFNAAIRLDDSDAEAYQHRAETLLSLGMWNEAIADCDRSIELDADAADAYRLRGEARFQLEQDTEALADFNAAIEAGDDSADAYLFRGIMLALRDEPTKAIGDFTRAINADPLSAEAYWERAHVYEALGKEKKADADRAAALRLDPNLADGEQ